MVPDKAKECLARENQSDIKNGQVLCHNEAANFLLPTDLVGFIAQHN